MNRFVKLEFDPAACKPIPLKGHPDGAVILTLEGHSTPWVNGQYRKLDEDYAEVVKLARAEVDRTGWCTICETTIGNGSVMHEMNCPLYDASDKDKW